SDPVASGVQTVTTTFALQSGGSRQAVRGVFRFGGTALSCGVNSGYDDYDDLIFAVAPTLTRTLTVASSNPGSGVSITVSPNDNSNQGNGTTQFTRSYNNNTNLGLTAPSTANGNNFQKWQLDGVDLTTSLLANFIMDV